jgi:integrase/recombinase XerC
VAAELGAYLAGKPAGERVWPGTWWTRTADMIRIDLEAAGIPFAVPGPDGRPLAADFHALRHTFGVLAERGGATLREVTALMRHSDPKLTLKTYGRLRAHDLAAAIEKLPPVVPGQDIIVDDAGRRAG